MLKAGREEKNLAEERNDYHQGVPAITIILDGGWSKRSHSYIAELGIRIIIGKATGKQLFIGVHQHAPAESTWMFKNWDDSSSEMESGIILEDIKKVKATHGVRYIRFIGDGAKDVGHESTVTWLQP